MINLFPYTDAHELNLDWIVEQVKANDTKVKDLTNTVINMHFDFDSKADKATTYTKTEVNTLLAAKADTSSLATVATSGNYNDLTNKPTIPAAQVNSDWDAVSGVAQILNKPSLSSVATSGDYDDLINTPTIPAAQVNSDWNANTGVAQILNKPTTLAGYGITDAYTKSEVDSIIKHATFTGTTNANGLISMGEFKQIISAKSDVSTHCIVLFDYYGTSDYTVFKVLNGIDMSPIANTAVTVDYYYI